MPTPNWGPQAGVPMDQATFDAYVVSNPPGAPDQHGVLWGGAMPGWRGGSTMPQTPNPTSTPASDYWSQFYQNGPASVSMPQFQTGNQDQARVQQQQVIQDLQRLAMGDRNSAAQQQLSNAYGAARSQQSSLGSTMRGQSAGAAMRGIQAGQQGINRTLSGDQQMLQLQEQQAAQAMLAQLLAQQQGQDITQAQGMAQGVNQGNALEEAMKQFYAQQGAGYDVARGQIGGQFQSAQNGFALDRGDIMSGLLNRGVQGVATGAATYGTQPKSTQSIVDDAFDNG